MNSCKRYHQDNRNAAFALVVLFGAITALMWVTYPEHVETHVKYTSAVVPILVVILGIGVHQHYKLKKINKKRNT